MTRNTGAQLLNLKKKGITFDVRFRCTHVSRQVLHVYGLSLARSSTTSSSATEELCGSSNLHVGINHNTLNTTKAATVSIHQIV